MEALDTKTQQSDIKSIRILRPTEAAAEKEFVKEFFRFVGCLVVDVRIVAEEQFKEEMQNPVDYDVDLVLISDFKQQDIFPTIPEVNKRRIDIYADLNSLTFQEVPNALSRKFQENQKEQFIRTVIDSCIDAIWYSKKDALNRKSLYKINELFFKLQLLPYLQIKRTFRIANMNEVLALSSKRYDIPYKPYLSQMIKAFDDFRKELYSFKDEKNKNV